MIEDPDDGTTGQTLVVSGEIIGVKNIDTYWCCKSCNSKIELHTNLNFTTCSKCGLVQKKTKLAEKCVVHLLLELEDGSETIVTVFQNVLNTITGGGGPLTPKIILSTAIGLHAILHRTRWNLVIRHNHQQRRGLIEHSFILFVYTFISNSSTQTHIYTHTYKFIVSIMMHAARHDTCQFYRCMLRGTIHAAPLSNYYFAQAHSHDVQHLSSYYYFISTDKLCFLGEFKGAVYLAHALRSAQCSMQNFFKSIEYPSSVP